MRVLKYFKRYAGYRGLALLLAVVLLFEASPSVTVNNRQVRITFGPPEAYAAGTADYSLGTNGATNANNISTALNALPNQGGLFHFKVGTYNITTNSTSGAIGRVIGNVTIEGEGKGTFFTGNGSWSANGSNWVFRDLAVNQTSMLPANATWVRVYTPDYPNGISKDTSGTYNISTLNAPTGRTATILIAGSDANTTVKNQADYVANATRDDITINNAIRNNPGKKIYGIGTFHTSLDSINVTASNQTLDFYTEALIYYSGTGNAVQINSPTATTNLNHLNISLRVYTSGAAVNSTTAQGVMVNNANLSDFPYLDIQGFHNSTGLNWTATTADATQTGWSEENYFSRWSLRDNKINLALSGNGSMQRLVGSFLFMSTANNISGRQYGVYESNTWGKTPSSISIQQVAMTTYSPNFTGWQTTGQSHHIGTFVYDDVAANGTTVAINSTQEIYIGNINTVEGVANPFTNLYIPPASFLAVLQRTYTQGPTRDIPTTGWTQTLNGSGAMTGGPYGLNIVTGASEYSYAKAAFQLRGISSTGSAVNFNFNKITVIKMRVARISQSVNSTATIGIAKTPAYGNLTDMGVQFAFTSSNALAFESYNSTLGTISTGVSTGDTNINDLTIILMPGVFIRAYSGTTLVANQTTLTTIPTTQGNVVSLYATVSKTTGNVNEQLELYNMTIWQAP